MLEQRKVAALGRPAHSESSRQRMVNFPWVRLGHLREEWTSQGTQLRGTTGCGRADGKTQRVKRAVGGETFYFG